MKTYNVEIQRTSYITVVVEANSKDEADTKAMDEIMSGYAGDSAYANWEVVSVEEV